MAHLIDKDAALAEIEKLYNEEIDTYTRYILDMLKSNIDTLEVKEVDLDEEINRWQGCEAFPEGTSITPLPKAMEIVERTAKHFFELGLKAQKGEEI